MKKRRGGNERQSESKGGGGERGSVKTTLVEAPTAITWTQTSRRGVQALHPPQHPDITQHCRCDAKLIAECIHQMLSLRKSTQGYGIYVSASDTRNYFRTNSWVFIEIDNIIMLCDVRAPFYGSISQHQ
jgi:hypothetical protein